MRSLSCLAAVAIVAATLGGCASSYRLDSTVQTFSSLVTLPPQPTYRFERLPSQANTVEQARAEALADPVLRRAGLRRDDAAPRFSVQVVARTQPVLSASPLGGGSGWGWWGYWPPIQTAANTAYQREVDVVVREIAGGRVVFESKAWSENFYLNSDEVHGALFEAALTGFPNPPPGPRLVNLQVHPVALPPGPVQPAPVAAPSSAPPPMVQPAAPVTR
ncbi:MULTISPECIES: DUF4136 domain-containing protein [Ramlibacter]|uniref:DUF4136 domain-containing protein n=1 Tax=Ramlibacter pinisoli TaxID=2682844 RepID=A0A6N8IZ94_9BURK|nr:MULTISPECIES: DUF4136 domain-containing protein [Ramlibacter]MBA2961962.1 hypothetical protein [Ramlibacter sp. CGMCC 1.13660]MVQ31905.1 DUF4136 domain-containing protein [Ramlibacter pinisoli]